MGGSYPARLVANAIEGNPDWLIDDGELWPESRLKLVVINTESRTRSPRPSAKASRRSTSRGPGAVEHRGPRRGVDVPTGWTYDAETGSLLFDDATYPERGAEPLVDYIMAVTCEG